MAPTEAIKSGSELRQHREGDEERNENCASLRPGSASSDTSGDCPDRQPRPPARSTRKNTPVRPVYDDFPTAHLSITSGSAKSRHELAAKEHSERLDNSVVPFPLPLTLRRPGHTSSGFETKPPVPAIPDLANRFSKSDEQLPANNFEIGAFNFSTTEPGFVDIPRCNNSTQYSDIGKDGYGKESPMLSTLKRVWGNLSSPGTKLKRVASIKPARWQGESMEKGGLTETGGKMMDNQKKVHRNSFGLLRSDERSTHDAFNLVEEGRGLTPHKHGDSTFAPSQSSLPVQLSLARRSQVAEEHDEYGDFGAIDHTYAYDAGIGSGRHRNETDCEEVNLPIYSSGLFPAETNSSSSQWEGSTVDNILQHYARSYGSHESGYDVRDHSITFDVPSGHNPFRSRSQHGSPGMYPKSPGFNTGNTASDRPENLLKQSTAELRKERRRGKLGESSAGQPPDAALPQIPVASYQRTLNSASEGLGQTSSYGDTRNLLDFTQRSQWVSVNYGHAPSDSIPNSSRKHLAVIKDEYRNPFLRVEEENPPDVEDLPDRGADAYRGTLHNGREVEPSSRATGLRNDLERDVSRALRREVSDSDISMESIIENAGGRGFHSSSSSGLLSVMGINNGFQDGRQVNEQGFYDRGAIPPAWLGSQEFDRVRVPIGSPKCNLPSIHPSQSSSGASDLLEISNLPERDDTNDWETVGESGVITRAVTYPFRVRRGDVGDAGSSVANTSDQDDLSVYHAFLLSERIMQHPATIEYSDDYRRCGIKETTFPVLLPSGGKYTVNGFPVNSYRPFQQSSNVCNYITPVPLPEEHKNPFNSSPPDVMDGPSNATAQVEFRGCRQQYMPKSRNSASDKDSLTEADDQSACNWMDDFGDPGPSLRGPLGVRVRHRSVNQTPSQENDDSSGGRVHGMRTAGSSLADASSKSEYLDSIAPLSTSHSGQDDDESLVVPTGEMAAGIKPIDRPLFVKGPPGAFYRDLRSRPDTHRYSPRQIKEPAAARIRNRSVTEQPYPTNKLRPLSLFTVERPKTPAGPDGRHPKERRQSRNEFFYRSPLAEVKSRSWRNLYTRDQLLQQSEAARVGGIYDNESNSPSSRNSVGEDLKPSVSWKRILVTPHMFPWPREDSSIKTSTAGRKAKISIAVLLICCLFPPVLLLYSIGWLDCLMEWWTKGQICSFGKVYKKLARQLGLFCVMCAIIGAAVGFCVHFSRPEL